MIIAKGIEIGRANFQLFKKEPRTTNKLFFQDCLLQTLSMAVSMALVSRVKQLE